MSSRKNCPREAQVLTLIHRYNPNPYPHHGPHTSAHTNIHATTGGGISTSRCGRPMAMLQARQVHVLGRREFRRTPSRTQTGSQRQQRAASIQRWLHVASRVSAGHAPCDTTTPCFTTTGATCTHMPGTPPVAPRGGVSFDRLSLTAKQADCILRYCPDNEACSAPPSTSAEPAESNTNQVQPGSRQRFR